MANKNIINKKKAKVPPGGFRGGFNKLNKTLIVKR